jgi:GntR family transcriptional regulator
VRAGDHPRASHPGGCGANQREAELLHVELGAPLMLLNSVSYLEDGAPIEYYQAVHRGDRSRFEAELIRVFERS